MPEKPGLWDRLPDLPLPSSAGIWDQVDRDLSARMEKEPEESEPGGPAAEGGSFAKSGALAKSGPIAPTWTDLVFYQPVGVWEDIDEETLLIRAEELSLWLAVERDVARIGQASAEKAQPGIWDKVEDETIILSRKDLKAKRVDVWENVTDETLLFKKAKRNVWESISSEELYNYRPHRVNTWALKALTEQDGTQYYILKHTAREAYLRLAPQQRYIWDLLDGRHSLQEIVFEYLVQYKSFDIDGLMAFIDRLSANGFLANPRVNVYQEVDRQQAKKTFRARLLRLLSKLYGFEFSIRGIDGFMERAYQAFGYLFFKRYSYWLMGLITALGLVSFFVFSPAALKAMSDLETNKIWWVLPAFYVMLILVVFIHEISHALTVKHYRREVRRGGIGMVLGMLYFFVDTTDIWLSPRTARLLVSLNGPFSGFVIGGVLSLAAPLAPNILVKGLMFQVALTAYSVSAYQFNPLFKQDGYYLLMDWLEIPRLRERSIDFLEHDLWPLLRARQRLTRDELVFTLFAPFTLLWTMFLLFSFAIAIGRFVLGLFNIHVF